jgi:kumamolisin
MARLTSGFPLPVRTCSVAAARCPRLAATGLASLNMALPPSLNDGAMRRGVPDVAGAAAGVPGYRVVLNGAEAVKDGTSAVAPLWAALIAIANAQRGAPLGFINSALYSIPSLFRPIIQGNNRADGKGYDAGPGWNACTGLGVPRGADIIAALAAIPVA